MFVKGESPQAANWSAWSGSFFVRDEALELAVAWIQQRSVVLERYVRRI